MKINISDNNLRKLYDRAVAFYSCLKRYAKKLVKENV